MNSLQGIFDTRPKSKRNFIQENVKQLRTIQKPWANKVINASLPRKSNKFQHIAAKVPAHVTSSTVLKQRDLSTQEVEGTKNYDARSRRSILSSLSAVRSSDLRSIKSDQGYQPTPMLGRKSRIYPSSMDDHSNGRKSNTSEKILRQLKHNAVASQNNANSVIKTLSAMSLSRSPTESPNPESETVHCALSDKSVPSVLSEKNGQSAVSKSTGHRPFSGKSVQSAFSEKKGLQAQSEISMSLQPVRSVGCQTVLPEDTEGIFNDGVIKYPSSYTLEPMTTESSSWMARLPTRESSQQTDISPVTLPPLVPETSKTHLNPIPTDDLMTYNSTVKIPQPLHERLLQRYKGTSDILRSQNSNILMQRKNGPKVEEVKEKVLEEVQKQAQNFDKSPLLSHEIFDASYPLGHVPLPESERVETLRKLQKSYEDHIRQLNSLPVKTDTLKMRLRKIDIEKQLSKLEEGIKVFSRPKVFVKVGV